MWEGQYGQKVPCRLKSQDRKSLVAVRVVGLVSREKEWALRRTEKPGRQQDWAGSQGCDRKATLCLATLAVSWGTDSEPSRPHRVIGECLRNRVWGHWHLVGPGHGAMLLPVPPPQRTSQLGWLGNASPTLPHRPRILEMDKEENRRSVLLPAHRRGGRFSSENYRRKSYEPGEDCSEAAGSPARKVKMRRH